MENNNAATLQNTEIIVEKVMTYFIGHGYALTGKADAPSEAG